MNLMINILLIISVLIIPRGAFGCYNSILNLGDSISDNGNFFLSTPPGTNPTEWNFLNPPNGETFFHQPTGRCSNGRLIVDFMAEFLELPFITPYLEIKKNLTVEKFKGGVNFAVVGATVLDTAYLESFGTPTIMTNCTLKVQMDWFKDMLLSLCNTSSPSNCSRQLLSSSLISMGMGPNDYNHALLARVSVKKVKSYLPKVIKEIAAAINELIKLGASTLMLSGNLPNGCFPAYLAIYENSTAKDKYNTTTGCINWLNDFSEYHNKRLQKELRRIRKHNPHVNLIYADYYRAYMQLIESPEQFGFIGETKLICCCGTGGKYNFHDSSWCGTENTSIIVCENPTQFISWDGAHATEAGYRWMAKGVLEGRYTVPPNPISTLCVSQI